MGLSAEQKGTTAMRMTLCAIAIVVCGGHLWAAERQTPVRVIFDTDMGSDCDDAGALAVLHKLADRGEVKILAAIFSSRGDVGDNRFGPGVVDAIDTYYGRPDLPIGANRGSDVGDPKAVKYLRQVGGNRAKYGHDSVQTRGVPEMVQLYRQVLSAERDKGVTILTVGHPVALYHLLKSGPDEFSPLGGRDLIAQKVDRWVAMGPAWNFTAVGMINYIGPILEQWPVDAYVSVAGEKVLTGSRLPSTPATNPVREVYTLYLGGAGRTRPSWDQIATLFAVRGTRPGLKVTDYGYWIKQGEAVEWRTDHDNPLHHRVDLAISNAAAADLIDTLMTEPPVKR
jgi:hypothetical protein